MLGDSLKKYTKKEISKILNISYPTLCRWLNDEQIESHVKFLKLLIYLKVDIKDYIKSIED